MRNPEQKVAFHLETYYKAEAFYNRMTVAVDKAKREQADAVAYAASALASAIVRSNTSPELEKARFAVATAARKLGLAELHLKELELLALNSTKPVSAGLEYAQTAVTNAERKHEALVQTALACQRAAKVKLEAVTETYQEACDERDAANQREHAETLRQNAEIRDEKSREDSERLRKIGFEGGTTSMNETLNNAN